MLKSIYGIVSDDIYARFHNACNTLKLEPRAQFAKAIERETEYMENNISRLHDSLKKSKSNGIDYAKEHKA